MISLPEMSTQMVPNLSFGGVPAPALPALPGMSFSSADLNWGAPVAAPASPYATMANYGYSLLPGPAAAAVPSPVAPMDRNAPAAAPAGSELASLGGIGGAVMSNAGAAPVGFWGGLQDGLSNLFTNEDGSFNFGALGDVAKGIGAFGSLYMGFQANDQAADALSFQKKAYKTNLDNSISSYNLALEDRIRSRTAQQGGSQEEADAYINKHKLGR